MSIISKDLFVKTMEELRDVENYHKNLNDFFRNNSVDGYIYQPDCTVTVIRLLHELFGKADEGDLIEYFCYELNFGKDYKPGCVTDSNKNDIKLATIEDLYDFLIDEAVI